MPFPSQSPEAFRRDLSRRGFLKGSLLATGGLALAGCGTTLARGVAGTPLAAGTVDFWNLFGGGDGERLKQMLDKFEQDNPISGSKPPPSPGAIRTTRKCPGHGRRPASRCRRLAHVAAAHPRGR
jgi:hypothetical protein